jgi:TctA family transporter
MLTLGIPGNAVMALMIGALTIHGIQPGPQIMSERPQLFWGMVASMWLGNLMLVIINLPLIGIWVQLLKVPYRFLYLAILLFCGIGVYTVGNSTSAVLLAAFFGVVGFILMRLDCEPAPMILGFVLGPLMEENLRRAMKIASGDPMIFVQRPISLGLLIAAALLLLVVALPAIRGKREEVFQEG